MTKNLVSVGICQKKGKDNKWHRSVNVVWIFLKNDTSQLINIFLMKL